MKSLKCSNLSWFTQAIFPASLAMVTPTSNKSGVSLVDDRSGYLRSQSSFAFSWMDLSSLLCFDYKFCIYLGS